MINKFYSVLNRGLESPNGRAVSSEAYKAVPKYAQTHNVLVPSGNLEFSGYCTEQILQVVLNSSYKQTLFDADPLNTYEHPIVFPRTFQVATISSATVSVMKNGTLFSWVSASFDITVDPIALQATVIGLGKTNTYDFTMDDNLSSKIPLDDGIHMRITGPLPGTAFPVHVDCQVPFNRNINSILPSDVAQVTWFNADYRRKYTAEVNPVEKTAILAFNLYEGLTNG